MVTMWKKSLNFEMWGFLVFDFITTGQFEKKMKKNSHYKVISCGLIQMLHMLIFPQLWQDQPRAGGSIVACKASRCIFRMINQAHGTLQPPLKGLHFILMCWDHGYLICHNCPWPLQHHQYCITCVTHEPRYLPARLDIYMSVSLSPCAPAEIINTDWGSRIFFLYSTILPPVKNGNKLAIC